MIRSIRVLVAALVAVAASLALAQVGHANGGDPEVPSRLVVPEGNKAYLVSHAVGVQIYSCNATATGYAWTFVAPRADLYDHRGRKPIGTHFAGPTWRASDGSKVVGARVDGATVDPKAIDWLLLSAVSTAEGPRGDDLADTTFIQRINTTGGIAPAATNCNAATAGTTVEVPYTADYVFWRARRRRCD